ncbi:hypothetical protein PRIPAC_88574 [Pristionchus pacificus]|uniref:Uncharacterized protein n=1 Tax=Pristionchus pacificus TaxID=54126 RepID=A0A2A6CXH6_PRIPA|nr:hypothetical protein PRIPAC_88574 [Pristionchus pacificus]|eukprot:PDM82733.1 hypothetical protein PRIPAC_37126 [Pristionchus pacificus]
MVHRCESAHASVQRRRATDSAEVDGRRVAGCSVHIRNGGKTHKVHHSIGHGGACGARQAKGCSSEGSEEEQGTKHSERSKINYTNKKWFADMGTDVWNMNQSLHDQRNSHIGQ